MGARSLRDDEYEFIQDRKRSAEICNLLRSGRGAQAAAAKRIEQLYLEKFGGILAGETDGEFQERLSKNPKATRMHAETEELRAHRLKMAPSRILGILKRDSDKYSRRRRDAEKETTPAPKLSPPKSMSTKNIYREFQSSQHPSKPKMKCGPDTPKAESMREWNHNLKAAFDALPAEEVERLQAQVEAKALQDESEEGKEARRAKYAEALPAVTKRAAHTWQKEGGWVGMILSGGIDQYGQVTAVHRPTGRDRFGKTFEERLAEEFRCTPRFIEVLFLKWLSDIFDAPMDDVGHKDSISVSVNDHNAVTLPSPASARSAANHQSSPVSTLPSVLAHADAVQSQVEVPRASLPPNAPPPPVSHGAQDESITKPTSIVSSPPETNSERVGVANLEERAPAAAKATCSPRLRFEAPANNREQSEQQSSTIHPFIAMSAPAPALESSDDDDVPDARAASPPKSTVLVPKLVIQGPTAKTTKSKKDHKPRAKSGPGTGRRSVQASIDATRNPPQPKKKHTKVDKLPQHKGAAAPREVLVPAGATNLAVANLQTAAKSLPATATKKPVAAKNASKKPVAAKDASKKSAAKEQDPNAAKSTIEHHPVSTRTGRTVKPTWRDLKESPDYSAAKYARRSGDTSSTARKHGRDTADGSQDDEPRKKRK